MARGLFSYCQPIFLCMTVFLTACGGGGGGSSGSTDVFLGEAERKLKLPQVCPRNLSHCRGAPQQIVPYFVPTLDQNQ